MNSNTDKSDKERVSVVVEDGTETEKRELSTLITRLRTGAKIVVIGNAKERTLTVTAENPPDWEHLGNDQYGLTLSGYGTTYCLSINKQRKDWFPSLSWPSNSGTVVLGIEIIASAPVENQIQSEKTCADMFDEVAKYNGL